MKPFDLELAKQGKPVITRCGLKALYIGYDPLTDRYSQVLFRVIESDTRSSVRTCSLAGRYLNGQGESDLDLFMAPDVKKLKLFVNLYPDDNNYGYSTKELAVQSASAGCTGCVEIDYEVKVDD